LGERNYARLGLGAEKYFKSYTQQPFGAEDVQQQFNWNGFVMSVYGPMLYAFVTDMAMQLTEPVFQMDTPAAVTLEFMELNELISELERYQSKSADRSSRVGDSAVAQEPIEKHLDDFFKSRDEEEQEKIADANVVIIALPDQGDPDVPVPVPARPGEDPKKPKKKPSDLRSGSLFRPSAPVRFGAVDRSQDVSNTTTFGKPSNQITVGARDIDQGVRRPDGPVPVPPEITVRSEARRSALFRRLNR